MTENLESLSNSILTLDFATKGLLLVIVGFFLAVFAIFFFYSYQRNRLLSGRQKGDKRLPVVMVSLGEAFGAFWSNFLVTLPILGGIIVAAGLVLGVSKAVSSVNAFIDREKEIQALAIAINYLNQSDKVLDARVRSVGAGVITVQLDYKASDPDSSVPSTAWTKTISIAGSELHFDCAVFNFSYSEVGAGRQRNIAIPYRVFSDKIAAADGILLFSGEDVIPEEDDYGFIPLVYRDKLSRLLSDGDYARDMGIRSINGSDVWRANVRAGDRFRIRVEQTGGLTLEMR